MRDRERLADPHDVAVDQRAGFAARDLLVIEEFPEAGRRSALDREPDLIREVASDIDDLRPGIRENVHVEDLRHDVGDVDADLLRQLGPTHGTADV